MSLREELLKNKPKVHPFDYNGVTYFFREFNVKEMNDALYGQHNELLRLAEQQGIDLNYDDEDELTKQLAKVHDPDRLSRALAIRLCDADGNNLFDASSPDDLAELRGLDKGVYEALNSAVLSLLPKNSATDESSS
jgi:hypothetical protein|uniref:Tail assembly chaperone protein n=1 Tax=Phage sp. ct17O1 TaxID=2825789 RepID=A0A8S5PKF1_9VIRU|nr:MAG TPA: tail assembly chaperone protein [Phage sp. ct17O1]